ncbi:alpha/beta-hydrolase [Periconia macrospinosa]|uniref:Alpha/beta-hydrolase n=1 Tax=Periconia macrospinosa TaxID=97972 RepID=A0A2V1E1P3_9PLEO|nr:alpha/beta-hydrolase [Periconia macrospinosa]
MQNLPTVVFVHGAWHQPANYKSFIDALSSAGFPVYAPRLPSCTNTYTTPHSVSLAEDVAVVNSVIKERVEEGEEVLLVMHSYGGLVGTDALTNDLLRTTRAAAQQPGGVIHLLYQCAYILEPGTAVIDIAKETGFFAMWPQFVTDFPDGTCFPVDPSQMFFAGDEISSEIVKEALPLLVRSPLSAFNAPAKGDLWKKLPITYVHTLADYGVPHAYQTLMVDRAEKGGADLEKHSYNTSHSVFITKKEEMVQLALQAAEDKRNPK